MSTWGESGEGNGQREHKTAGREDKQPLLVSQAHLAVVR